MYSHTHLLHVLMFIFTYRVVLTCLLDIITVDVVIILVKLRLMVYKRGLTKL
jgi:hypothetical protein